MPTIKIYSKEQVDALISGAGGLPDPTSASAGDVLTLDSNKDPAWVAVSGGKAKHTYTTGLDAFNDITAHPDCFIFVTLDRSSPSYHINNLPCGFQILANRIDIFVTDISRSSATNISFHNMTIKVGTATALSGAQVQGDYNTLALKSETPSVSGGTASDIDVGCIAVYY